MITEIALLGGAIGTSAHYWLQRRHTKRTQKNQASISPNKHLGQPSFNIKRLILDIKSVIEGTDSQQLRTEMDASLQQATEQQRLSNKKTTHWSFGALSVTALAATYPALTLFGAGAILYLSRETLKLILNDFKRGHYLSFYLFNTIMMLGMIISGHLILSAISSIIFNFFAGIANRLENNAKGHLVNIFGNHPKQIWTLKEGIELQISFNDLQVSDQVVIHAGEVIPVDGQVISGIGQVDQHILTGESQPADKETGDNVFASTLLLSGHLIIKATVAGEDTVAAKISQALSQTQNYKDTLMLRGRQVGDRFMLFKIALATATFPIMGLNSALAIMWANLGQGVSITGPMSLMTYLQLLSREQILIKDGRVFESLQNIDTIVFDKTGTLTEEQPTLGAIHTANGFDEHEVLCLAAAAEHRQPHPIARAIIAGAKAAQLDYPQREAANYEVGYGIKVQIAGRLIRVGSARFLQRENIAIPENLDTSQRQAQAASHSLVYVGVDNRLAGILVMQPTIRPKTKEMVTYLQQHGIKVYIISGDHEAPTRSMAEQLGVDHYFAETLPENKANIVQQLKDEGRFVCFVGDGVNDAIALKTAQVSISLKGASTVATDTAQIIFMDGTLRRLTQLFDLVTEFESTMHRALVFSLVPGIFTVAGVFFLHFGVASSLLILYLNMCLGLSNIIWPIIKHQNTPLVPQQV
jgi:Cu2+-exporting ATPase